MPAGGEIPSLKLTVISTEQDALGKLVRRLARELDGKALRLELARNLRAAVKPAVDEIKAGALAMKRSSSSSTPLSKYQGPESGVSLGAAIARGIGTRVKLSGIETGVTIRASKKGMPRGFVNAPKRMNQASFRHPVMGRKGQAWVVQVGSPGYFDRPIQSKIERYRAACVAAVEEMAARIARR